MRRSVALLSCLLALALTSACEKTPTCREAVERAWAPAASVTQPWVVEEGIERDVALCLDLQDQAAEAGCMAEHEAWRRCLSAGIDPYDYYQKLVCEWHLVRLQACLDGTAFEADCFDDVDNDGDGLVDCFDPDCSPLCWGAWFATSVPQSMDRALDLLFVIENASHSMSPAQQILADQFPAITTNLRNAIGGLPDLHLGVVTSDLGTGSYLIGTCQPGGDDGALQTGGCANPTGGAPYLIDVAPRGCDVTREANNTCPAHDCAQSHCAHEPTTTLVIDSLTSCPRCRNYTGETLEEAFVCLADVGTQGCTFSQPLEALHRALDPDHPANSGFLRERAYLAAVLVSDEDDCSASDPQLFDNSATDLESPLGPLTSFRCFEYGITCDIDDRTAVGAREQCLPREDEAALLHPIDRYADRLQELKAAPTLVVVALAGPVTPSNMGEGYRVVVARDASDQPEVQYSCTTMVDGGVPGIRIFDLVSRFNVEQDIAEGAYSSVCSGDFTPALAWVGHRLEELIEPRCPRGPLSGCADPGVEFGTPQAAQTCAINERCVPECSVGEYRYQGTAEEYDVWLPHCLEVCADGYCAGNQDRNLAYAGGHPPDRDPDLPVEVCWHVAYNPQCPGANYAEIRAARRADAPPRTFLYFTCRHITRDEQLCNDGQDNDEDCLVDADDPCCQNAESCRL
jgi:hypothetical protein